MAQRTIQIDGVGKVNVDDQFFQLSPDQQNAEIEQIAASVSHTASSAAPAAAPAPKATELDPEDVWTSLVNRESSNTAGAVGPETPYGRALGLAQVLASTGEGVAKKLGVPWRPDLMKATDSEGRRYQSLIGRAYFNEGLDKYGGDVRKALMYYHGGPDERQWGPKTQEYAQAILGSALGHPAPDAPKVAQQPDAAPVTTDLTTTNPPKDDSSDSDIPEYSPDQKAQILNWIREHKNASGDQLEAFSRSLSGDQNIKVGDADKVMDYIRKGGDPSKLAWAKPTVEPSPPSAPNPDTDVGHVAAVATRGAGQGATDILSQGVNSSLKAFLPSELIDKLNPGSTAQQAYDAIAGSFGKPQTHLDRYIAAVPEGAVAGALTGPEGGFLPMIRAGVGSSVGGQVAHDLGLPEIIGNIIGGGLAHPTISEAVTARVPVLPTKAKFVKNVTENPLGPDLVQVARDYKTLADQVHPKGAAPKGRQPLSVEEINSVGDRGLRGLRDKISKSNIPTAQKLLFKEALDHAVEIPLERSEGMGPDQIALSDLPDTVEGQAVKAAIRRAKAGDMLSARYGGEKVGPFGKLYNTGVDALPLPYGKGLLKLKGGDINKSRMDAAAKAIKRLPLYEKAGTRLPQSNFGPAMAALNDKVMATAQASDLAKAAQAAQLAQKAKAAAAVQASNDTISRKVERNIVRPSDGYRGLIYQQTGVTQPQQDVALLRMVKTGELQPEDMKRVMADPNSLMRGKSKAGLKIMDRIGELADQGVIERDPQWKGPPKADEMPSGVLNWLDAQGDPIRSMGAYAGGIVKNVIRELRDEQGFDDKVGSEPSPVKPKTKKKRKQGA